MFQFPDPPPPEIPPVGPIEQFIRFMLVFFLFVALALFFLTRPPCPWADDIYRLAFRREPPR